MVIAIVDEETIDDEAIATKEGHGMHQDLLERAGRKVKTFRELHDREGAFLIVNPWDAGSAKILEGLGFEALATTSGGFAWSGGRVDGHRKLDDVLAHCTELANVTSLPVSADLGIGFGESPEDVYDCIKQVAQTGVAGGSIEDTSVTNGNQLEFSLSVARVQAAVEAAQSSEAGFVLTARTEGYVYGGQDFDEVLRRLQAYDEAGADVLYAPGMRDLGEIREVCASVSKPTNVLIGFRGMKLSFQELADAGVKRVSVGTQLARIAYGSLIEAGRELLQTQAIVSNETSVRSARIARFMTSSSERRRRPAGGSDI